MVRNSAMRSMLFLIVIWELVWTCFAQDLVQITDRPNDVFTQTGCNVTEMCSAVDASIVTWSPTRSITTLTNTSSRTAGTIAHANGTMTAILTFTNITIADEGLYHCIIIFLAGGGSSLNTIRVEISIPERINITSIADYSLSNLTIGETLTVGCVIRTCGSPNNVSFISENSTVLMQISRTNDGAFNWLPEVTCELPGTYRCMAKNQLGMVSRTFTISGVPQPSQGSKACNASASSVSAHNMHTLSAIFLTSLLILPLVIIYN